MGSLQSWSDLGWDWRLLSQVSEAGVPNLLGDTPNKFGTPARKLIEDSGVPNFWTLNNAQETRFLLALSKKPTRINLFQRAKDRTKVKKPGFWSHSKFCSKSKNLFGLVSR
jgi:hypothetical protein